MSVSSWERCLGLARTWPDAEKVTVGGGSSSCTTPCACKVGSDCTLGSSRA